MGERLVRLAGSLTSGVLDGILDGLVLTDNLPDIIVGDERLPHAHDWASFGTSAVPFAISKLGKRRVPKLARIETFSEGAFLYSFPMLIKKTIVRAAHEAGGGAGMRLTRMGQLRPGQMKPQLR